MKTQQAMQEFVTDCRVGDLSDMTIRQYTQVIKRFARVHPKLPVTTPKARAYMASLYECGYSPHTTYDHIKCLFRFLAWCANEYSIPNPCTNIRKPKQPQSVVRAVKITDFIAMFDGARQTHIGTAYGYRYESGRIGKPNPKSIAVPSSPYNGQGR
jgi:site-specific recombinase XerD